MKITSLATAAATIVLIAAPFDDCAQQIISPNLPSLVGDDPDGTFSGWGDAFASGAATWEDWLFVGAPRETEFCDGDDPFVTGIKSQGLLFDLTP